MLLGSSFKTWESYGLPEMGDVLLIDPDGKLAQSWLNVKVPGHAQAVLDAIPAK